MSIQSQAPEENNQPQKSKLQEELEAMRAIRDQHEAEILKGAIDYHSGGRAQTASQVAEYAAADSAPGIWRGSPSTESEFSQDSRPVVVQINGNYIPGVEASDGSLHLMTDNITKDAEKARESAETCNRNLSYSGDALDLPPRELGGDKQPMEFDPIQAQPEMALEESHPAIDHARDSEAEWLNHGADLLDLEPGADLEPLPPQPLYLGGDDNQAPREFDQIEPAHGPEDFGPDYGPTDLEDFNREGPDNDGDDGGYDIDPD